MLVNNDAQSRYLYIVMFVRLGYSNSTVSVEIRKDDDGLFPVDSGETGNQPTVYDELCRNYLGEVRTEEASDERANRRENHPGRSLRCRTRIAHCLALRERWSPSCSPGTLPSRVE